MKVLGHLRSTLISVNVVQWVRYLHLCTDMVQTVSCGVTSLREVQRLAVTGTRCSGLCTGMSDTDRCMALVLITSSDDLDLNSFI